MSGLPGAGAGAAGDGSRSVKPDIRSCGVRFSPTGREWAVACTQGLQVTRCWLAIFYRIPIVCTLSSGSQLFSLDDALIFAPTEIDMAITPQSIETALLQDQFSLALSMALHLGEQGLLARAVAIIGAGASLDLVVRSVDLRLMKSLMTFIANQLVSPSLTATLLPPFNSFTTLLSL